MSASVFPLPATVPLSYLAPKYHGARWIPPHALRRAVWEASGRRCYLCGRAVAERSLSLDHVIPRHWIRWTQRKHHFANLAASHAACNKARGRRLYLRHSRLMIRAAMAMLRGSTP